MKAQIRLDDLPQHMHKDSSPARVGDEIVVVASLDKKGWFVLPSDRCSSCRGRGFVKYIRHDETVSTDEATGKEKTERISYEEEEACGCVLNLAQAEEMRRSVHGVPSGPAPKPREDPRPDHLRKRAERLRAEIQAKVDEIAEMEAVHRMRVDCFQAYVDNVEYDAAALLRAEREATDLLNGCTEQVKRARQLVAEALDNQREAEAVESEAVHQLDEKRRALGDTPKLIERAKEEARRENTQGGSSRHKIQVEQKRLADLKHRLAAVERDLPKAVEEPPAESLAPAAAGATP